MDPHAPDPNDLPTPPSVPIPPSLPIIVLISFSRDSVLAFAMDWSALALFSPPRPTRAASFSSFLRQQGS